MSEGNPADFEEAIRKELRRVDTEATGRIPRAELIKVITALDPDHGDSALQELAAPDGEDVAYEDFISTLCRETGATELEIQFVSGSTISVPVAPGDTIADLKAKVVVAAAVPKNKSLKILSGDRVPSNTEPVSVLFGKNITAVFSASEKGYLKLNNDKDDVVMVDEGDANFDEKSAANVDPEKWVPQPEEHPDSLNLARESLGVHVSSSSCIWGDGISGQQKSLNVLRLGSAHGDPRYSEGDSSFIFKDRDSNQMMTLSFGRVVSLVRIGTMCSSDRWLNSIKVETSEGDEEGPWEEWGADGRNRRDGGVAFFDRAPTCVRLVRFTVSSGHYHGAGARLGPVFAWGWHSTSD